MSKPQSTTTNSAQQPTDRVTVLLPPWLFHCVIADARKRMISSSAVVREKLAEHYRDQEKPERP